MYLRVLDRLFGEYVTGYSVIIDEKHWTKGDHGGWIRLVNSKTRSILMPTSTTGTTTTTGAGAVSGSNISRFRSSFTTPTSTDVPTTPTASVSAAVNSTLTSDDQIIRLLSPHSIVMEIFMYQYKQREYAMRVEVLPQKIKALFYGSALMQCYSSPIVRALGTQLYARCTNQVSHLDRWLCIYLVV